MPSTFLTHMSETIRAHRSPVDLTDAVKCRKNQKSIAMGPKYLVTNVPSKLMPPVLGPENMKKHGPIKWSAIVWEFETVPESTPLFSGCIQYLWYVSDNLVCYRHLLRIHVLLLSDHGLVLRHSSNSCRYFFRNCIACTHTVLNDHAHIRLDKGRESDQRRTR